MRLPLPQEFHQHFASIGLLCLPQVLFPSPCDLFSLFTSFSSPLSQSLFLQYVNRGVIRVTASFITEVISLLLPPLPPSSSPSPPSIPPSSSSSSSPIPSPSEEEEAEREEEEDEEEEETYLDSFSPFIPHSIFTCSDPNCNPHLVSQVILKTKKEREFLFCFNSINSPFF